MAAPGWQAIMRRSRPLLVIDRYQDAREWWAEDWALCITGYLAQLIQMIGGYEIAAEMTCLSAARIGHGPDQRIMSPSVHRGIP
jgi:hypothetical protein